MLPLDTPQTFVSAGGLGIGHKDRDWHAAVVMNYILGGDSEGRLMTEIREKRGLTYGAYSSISSMKHAALIQASFSASNEKVEEALRVLKAQWKEMAARGVTARELDEAKSYLTGSLLLQLTSTEDISSTLNSIQRDDLGPDYINTRNAAIEGVTLDDVRRVAARLLKAEDLAVVLVGQPKNINVDILLDKPPGMKPSEAEKR
jgi:zinc protease